jgi:hypothetical protein
VTAATERIAEQCIDTTERIIAAMQTIKAMAISRTREPDLQNFQNNRQEHGEE